MNEDADCELESQNSDDDPIVAEVRIAREAYAAKFNFDLRAMCEDLQRRTDEAARAGKKVVSLPPRRPDGWPGGAKKAG
jgi:hypothetical protein